MTPTARLLASVIALLAVFLIGMFGFMFVEADKEPTLLDAAFMTAITLSTVGYGEVWDLSDTGKLWSIIIITFGIGTVSIAFTSLITLFVGGELRTHREKEIMQKTIDQLDDHVIICGFGRMGRLIARTMVSHGGQVAVIELKPDLGEELRELGVPHILGNATDDGTLLRAGLERAKALICVLPHDADNVFVTLSAHSIRPDLKIISRAEQQKTEDKLHRAGAAKVICPQVIGASRIVDVLERPNVVDFVDVAAEGVDLEMDEYVISENSRLVGVALRDCNIRQDSGAMVVAIKRADGQTLFNPGAEAVIQAGDTLIMVGQAGMSERIDRL
ncbi:MAG: potassium channel family protein [Planctomycetota bacterium]